MNILTQTIENLKNQELIEAINTKCAEYIAPITSSLSAANYGELIASLSDTIQFQGREILKNTFEAMDLAFRNSPARVYKYYVKQTRNRMIVTVFGEVTYKRTE